MAIPKFYGYIIENDEVVGVGHFESVGFWVAGGKRVTSYIRTEDKENEDDFCTEAQYSRMTTKGDDGKTINFFFIETYDGADFKAYVEGIKAQKEV